MIKAASSSTPLPPLREGGGGGGGGGGSSRAPQFSAEDAKALFYFTYKGPANFNIFTHMNKAMREENQAALEQLRPMIFHVSVALSKLPCVPACCVYRGINVVLEKTAYRRDSEFIWNAFSSTSRNVEVGKSFCAGAVGTLFLLHVNTGKNISQYSQFPNEEEVLMPPNSRFHVVSWLSDNMKAVLNLPRTLSVVELEEIKPEVLDPKDVEYQFKLMKMGVVFKGRSHSWARLYEICTALDCTGDWIFEAINAGLEKPCKYQVTLNQEAGGKVTGKGIFRPQQTWTSPIPFFVQGSLQNLEFSFHINWGLYGVSFCECRFDPVNGGVNAFQGVYRQSDPQHPPTGVLRAYKVSFC
eukprot:TRINITY_DN1599_c0_g1_i1.p1 TRINITY_DN1599_c0_g1~~TRINITY_DN1599_c0_g1_i1.p1  ORF type:complete len:355 (-),score=37.74 TRINITY_DN1599_c0_g1_i1:227-1291(-)